MKYRRIQLNSKAENLDHLLLQIAKWHNDAPRLWIPDYNPTNEDIRQTMEKIRNTKDEDLFLTVAEDENGRLRGFIWAYRLKEPSDNVMISSLYVTKDYRRQGIATYLKVLLEEWCRANGIKTIQTTTHYNNKSMIELNKKLGYVPGMVYMSKSLL